MDIRSLTRKRVKKTYDINGQGQEKETLFINASQQPEANGNSALGLMDMKIHVHYLTICLANMKHINRLINTIEDLDLSPRKMSIKIIKTQAENGSIELMEYIPGTQVYSISILK